MTHLHVKDAGDADGTAQPGSRQKLAMLWLVTVLQADTEGSTRKGVHASLNMGLTCSWWVAEVKGACTWDTDSMRALARGRPSPPSLRC